MYIYTPTITSSQFSSNKYLRSFVAVFGLRYIRVLFNIIGNILYMPTAIMRNPRYDASDVTVMILAIGLNSELLHRVVKSILTHPIARLIIVTSGPDFQQEAKTFTEATSAHESNFSTVHTQAVDERQLWPCHTYIKTSLAVFQDNKTTWPSSTDFLLLMMAPFEDPKMGAVMPLIEARHHHYRSPIEAYYNFLGMT